MYPDTSCPDPLDARGLRGALAGGRGAGGGARRLGAAAACLGLTLGLWGCSPPAAPEGGAAEAPAAVEQPERLVTLGGAVTETVFALGAGERVVGVDTSSLWPASATELPQVGYQRKISPEAILALRPTRVLAVASTGPGSAVEQLRGAGVEVEVLPEGDDVAGARARIERLGALLGKEEAAAGLLKRLDGQLAEASERYGRRARRPRVLFIYARGARHLLVAGSGTSAEAMIQLGGGVNAAEGVEGFKPLTPEAALEARPDVVLVPKLGLESLGGVDGVLKLPGLAQTPAGEARAVIALDDLKLLGFGPRTGEAALELGAALEGVEVVDERVVD